MDDFKSGLSQKMQAFLDYEKSAGYSESTYLSRLRNLDVKNLVSLENEISLI